MSTVSLTPVQLATFRAAADRIVPPDETCGAAEAGAEEFILRLLGKELSGELGSYLAGLDGIESESQAHHGRSFSQLTPDKQDAILTAMEGNRVKTDWVISPQSFFQKLVENVLEGFYADPGNGGNRDAVSWKMMGYRAEGGTW
jgi:hypothetical protein